MADTSLKVKINASFDVDKNTAETCLRLVSIYMNEHGLTVYQKTNKDGTIALEFIERKHTW